MDDVRRGVASNAFQDSNAIIDYNTRAQDLHHFFVMWSRYL